jgi:steroid 5-alpha reductase family enzyme
MDLQAYLFALTLILGVAVAAWVVSVMIRKVSGVAMLGNTITDRRPDCAEYIRRTNAFFPGLPRRAAPAWRETAQ